MLRKFLKKIFDKLTVKYYRDQIISQQETLRVEMRHIYNQLFLNNPILVVQNVKMYLPLFYVDHIQKIIFQTRNFYEIETLTFLQLHYKKFEHVIDIGGNIGNHVLYYCSCMDATQVHCFEPNKFNREILKKNIDLNNLSHIVKIYPAALGSQAGKDIQEDFTFSNTGMNRVNKIQAEDKHENEIEIKPLDEFDIQKVNFIKIDVEGFELDVLKGSEQIIKRCKPVIMVEVFENNRLQIDELMGNYGYGKLTTLGEFNCLYTPQY